MQFIIAPAEQPPFVPDVMILEEDTALVLSADTQLKDPGVGTFKILMDLYEMPEYVPGSIVTRDEKPFQVLAVVHDLDQEITTRLKWIQSALQEALAYCETQNFRLIAIQPLGSVHGKVSINWFIDQLTQHLNTRQYPCFDRVWVMTEVETTK